MSERASAPVFVANSSRRLTRSIHPPPPAYHDRSPCFHLVACTTQCLGVRTVERCSQFYESGCENCPFFGMEGERDRVADCTTPNFQSLITVMEPSSSWAAKWLHLCTPLRADPSVYRRVIACCRNEQEWASPCAKRSCSNKYAYGTNPRDVASPAFGASVCTQLNSPRARLAEQGQPSDAGNGEHNNTWCCVQRGLPPAPMRCRFRRTTRSTLRR